MESLVLVLMGWGLSRDVAVNLATDGVVLALTNLVIAGAYGLVRYLMGVRHRTVLEAEGRRQLRHVLAVHWRLGAVILELEQALMAGRADQDHVRRLLRAIEMRADHVRKNYERLQNWIVTVGRDLGPRTRPFWANEFYAAEELHRAASWFAEKAVAGRERIAAGDPSLSGERSIRNSLERWVRADISAARRLMRRHDWEDQIRAKRQRVASAWQGGQSVIADFWVRSSALLPDQKDEALREEYVGALMGCAPRIAADPST